MSLPWIKSSRCGSGSCPCTVRSPSFGNPATKKEEKKLWNSKDCFSETFSMSLEGRKYGVEKYTFVDADAGDLPVNARSDDDKKEEIDCAPTTNFFV